MEELQWHSLSPEEILKKLNGSEHGLSAEDAERRLKDNGPNKLPEAKVDGYIKIFFRQFASSLIYILLAAAAIMYAMGEETDALIILIVLIFNAIIGAIQEGKAQNTLLALKKFAETRATVLRDGKEVIIPDHNVVPGDIILLQEGEKVPADARIFLARSLKVEEASLTGESEPIAKIAERIDQTDITVADKTNMVFKGTNISSGNGRAIVVATGLETVIGKVATQIAAVDTEVPLKADIRRLSNLIIILVGIISVVLFAAGIALGNSVRTMFAIVVSLAVSVIPEGLPVVLTIVLATGVWRMSKRNALVKKLQAVEALGQARVIAVDKTGTITKNELVIQKVWTDGRLFDVNGVGYEPKGDFKLEGGIVDAANHPELLFIGKIASFCASAQLMYSEEEKRWRVSGDPTEAAMLVLGQKTGFRKDDLENESPLLSEIPFDYKLKYHATLHRGENKNFLTVVGAPEAVLDLCKDVKVGGVSRQLGKKERGQLDETVAGMSMRGLRVIAFAFKEISVDVIQPELMESLTCAGLVGMKDALRAEVADAMHRATSAGIKVVMITGDHRLTAQAIATEAGIYKEGDQVITGTEVDAMSDAELAARLARVSVFARVTPEHKLRIVTAYKKRGEIVAMTGDGVNDAPSLVAADLGVAMGKIGTEVAKEASDIILLDDNFGSIVSAVEEGRSIYKTIKKIILYLFSTSAGEVLVLIGALVVGLPLPFVAAQIIWLNFVTDGFLVVALAMEPKEKGLLSGTFARPNKYLIDSHGVWRMTLMALAMTYGTLFIFNSYVTIDLVKAQTLALTTLAMFQWFNAWNCRSDEKSIFQMNPFSNLYLVGATFIVILSQIAALYVPFMQNILHITSLSFKEWLIIMPIALLIVAVEEVRKIFYRLRTMPSTPR